MSINLIECRELAWNKESVRGTFVESLRGMYGERLRETYAKTLRQVSLFHILRNQYVSKSSHCVCLLVRHLFDRSGLDVGRVASRCIMQIRESHCYYFAQHPLEWTNFQLPVLAYCCTAQTSFNMYSCDTVDRSQSMIEHHKVTQDSPINFQAMSSTFTPWICQTLRLFGVPPVQVTSFWAL